MRKTLSLILLISLFLSGCNFAGAANTPTPNPPTLAPVATTLPPTDEPSPTTPAETPTAAATATDDTASPSASATSMIFPVVTIAVNSICRMGPDKLYNPVLTVTKGSAFEVSGRSADSAWVSINASKIGDDCWVPVASLESPGDLKDVNVRYTQPLPDEPVGVTASGNACGATHLWLYWKTVNAVGYRIYRNGKEIATVYGDQYRDLNTPRTKLPTIFLYEVASFNASGVSPRASVSVTICG